MLPWVKGDDICGFAVEGYRSFEGGVGGVSAFFSEFGTSRGRSCMPGFEG